jgi:hypothetical protein
MSHLIKKVTITEVVCVRIEPTQLAFVILGAGMAALALMILVTAILATGPHKKRRHFGSSL